MNIFLDIDGTLISESKGDKIIPRPYLKEFLDFCFLNCITVSIWTAAKSQWCKYVCKNFLGSERKFFLVYNEKNCTLISDIDPESDKPVSAHIKKLRNVWRKHKNLTKNNTFILDDTPYTYSKNYGNAIPISTYTGNPDDKELLKVIEVMEKKMGQKLN